MKRALPTPSAHWSLSSTDRRPPLSVHSNCTHVCSTIWSICSRFRLPPKLTTPAATTNTTIVLRSTRCSPSSGKSTRRAKPAPAALGSTRSRSASSGRSLIVPSSAMWPGRRAHCRRARCSSSNLAASSPRPIAASSSVSPHSSRMRCAPTRVASALRVCLWHSTPFSASVIRALWFSSFTAALWRTATRTRCINTGLLSRAVFRCCSPTRMLSLSRCHTSPEAT
mmetsp:Transcript_5645/g.14325  ORF Transcript_5645/g.14325 Transcript_5645/m.14325 type:complete len:225 (+) Transcript_5645:218-892(+)